MTYADAPFDADDVSMIAGYIYNASGLLQRCSTAESPESFFPSCNPTYARGSCQSSQSFLAYTHN